MDLKELEVFHFSDFPDSFCISWSEDDCIAVLSDKGLHVFEYFPSANNANKSLSFSRFFIKPQNTNHLSAVGVNNKSNSFLWKQTKQDAEEMIMDTKLAIHAWRILKITIYISKFEFSAPVFSFKRCILAVLTNLGDLHLYEKNKFSFDPIVDISKLWAIECKKKFVSNSKISYEEFKYRSSLVKIHCIHFLEQVDEGCYLITASENSCFAFWRIDLNYNVNLVGKLEFSLNKPCSMDSYKVDKKKYILCVGYITGEVEAYELEVGQNIKILHTEQIWSDSDHILVNKIITTPKFVLIIKHHIIIVVKTIYKTKLSKIGEEFMELESAISGVTKLSDSKCLICLMNNKLELFVLTKDVLHAEKIPNTLKSSSEYSSNGIACSRNGLFIIQLFTPLRQSLLKYEKNRALAVVMKINNTEPNSKLNQEIISKMVNGKLTNIWDYLELKRLRLLNKKIDLDMFQDNSSLECLKLKYWELQLLIKLNNTKDFEIYDIRSSLEKEIIKCFLNKQIETYGNLEMLSECQSMSWKIMKMFASSDDMKVYDSDFNCPICEASLKENYWRYTLCVNEHRIPRCCLSFLPCLSPYSVNCRICGIVALIQFIENNDGLCPLCDRAMHSIVKMKKL